VSMPIILYLVRLPGQLDSQMTATVLGVQDHDIPTLVKARLLKPLGNPKPNSPKYFAAVEVEAFARDRDFLDKAQRAIQRHWQAKNRRGKIQIEIMPKGNNRRGTREGPDTAA